MKITNQLYDKINEFYEGKKETYNSILVEIHDVKGSLSEFVQTEIAKTMEENIFEPWHPVKQEFCNSFGLFQILSTTPNDFRVMVRPHVQEVHSLQLNINITPNNII